ncbi:AraC family transcriptional regulator [Clostridium sp. AN503]|uniref:helix-turn-helix transcriptional regulator n=1 Tax=Clostridium sp. AN503 TaxID=3160598 RepID=UPI003458662B
MQQKTSSTQFEKYGTIYKDPIDLAHSGMISRDWHVNAEKKVTQLYRYDCEVCLEMQSGIAALLVGETPDADSLEIFAVHRMVRLKPHMYFALVAISSDITCKMILDAKYTSSVEPLATPYNFRRILPRIKIREILGYYYSIRSNDYHFDGETHDYFELTYVDLGAMTTVVDGVRYELKERELMIYGPGQFHTQEISSEGPCSYVTIIFDMESSQFEPLLNRVFPYEKKIHTLLKTFILESTSQLPYMNSLMLCLLQETIIRLLQNDFTGSHMENEHLVTGARQHYQDEFLEKILAYIDENICKPMTIAEICQKFSLSRSSLQILFKENLNQSPKKYINELKMEKSRQMICEDKYTISEIALMMGFNSIHYFSRAFTQKYRISPSEYSKTLFKA